MDIGERRRDPNLLSEPPPPAEWVVRRSPCGWFESVRAAPSGDEIRPVITGWPRHGFGCLGDEITSGRVNDPSSVQPLVALRPRRPKPRLGHPAKKLVEEVLKQKPSHKAAKKLNEQLKQGAVESARRTM